MTNTAKKLGMQNTRFMNASGLHNKYQKSTAKDMAILAIAIRRDFPSEYKILTLNLSNGTVENTITIIISLNLTMEQMALKRVILMHQDLT